MVVTPVKIGQQWRRKNGAVVIVTDERIDRGQREVLLTPAPKHKGRASWKWDLAVMWDLEPIEHEEA